jgi:hypothetical protein
MQRARPLHPSVSLLLEFRIRYLLCYDYQLLRRFLSSKMKMFSVRGFTTITRSGFEFCKLIFDSGHAGALPSCANVCKRPKTDFLRGASGSTRSTGC